MHCHQIKQSKGYSLIWWAAGRNSQVETFLRKFEIRLRVRRRKKYNLIVALITATVLLSPRCFLIIHLSDVNLPILQKKI